MSKQMTEGEMAIWAAAFVADLRATKQKTGTVLDAQDVAFAVDAACDVVSLARAEDIATAKYPPTLEAQAMLRQMIGDDAP